MNPPKLYLSIPEIPLAQAPSLDDARCTLANPLTQILQRTGNTITQTLEDLKPPNPEEFLNSLKGNSSVYQASMSRQFAADLPPDIEQTTLKDEPKDWYIKTADFGDDSDRVLQHRDGEYTQLLEDLATYDQILQEHCHRIIILRPPNYGRYDLLINAAMRCLGYTEAQFQFIIVQPIKLYAFHKPSQKLHALPELPIDELIKAIGIDALRWHSLATPLTKVAPINISTAGQLNQQDSLYRIQTTHARCCTLLEQAHQHGTIELEITDDWQIKSSSPSLEELVWEDGNAAALVKEIQKTPTILQASADAISGHLLYQHLEHISDVCDKWCLNLSPTAQDCSLLLATKHTLFDVLESILGMKTRSPEI
ncbi:DALR anticodon-binding domain-containing protein [Roseofilum sp. Guam]|uniref:DALR anticodon-binding domain-containing protein n=1 Tax=Roseofilum sp. Guam TaxID=2821502 RepID=UPI00298DF654|nr:DALR anticodon-binding domain-containing protein [Roseofilum sp. Guam]